MDSLTPTREKLKEVREKIHNKSVMTSAYVDDVEVPMESFWQEFKDLNFDYIDYDCNSKNLITVTAKSGLILDVHYHLITEVLYVVSGKIKEITSDVEVSIGETITFNKKSKHGIEFLEDTVLLVHWIC